MTGRKQPILVQSAESSRAVDSRRRLIIGGFGVGAAGILMGGYAGCRHLQDMIRTARNKPIGKQLEPVARTEKSETNYSYYYLNELTACSDQELAGVDVAVLNLVVLKELPEFQRLFVPDYIKQINSWATAFASGLPQRQSVFYKSPHKWKNDIRFFRLGMLCQFLDQTVGIKYVDELKQKQVLYTNPSDLFLNGLVDKKIGTCGSMPVLHVAIGKRLGWPVHLTRIKHHYLCRFDDGRIAYNIEATDTGRGGFASPTDQEVMDRFNIQLRSLGIFLRPMKPREVLGSFILLLDRYFNNTNQKEKEEHYGWLGRQQIRQALADLDEKAPRTKAI